MGSWHSILSEIKTTGSAFDVVRRQYLKQLSEKTNRNTIIYYSGWLQKSGLDGTDINDADKNGFMTVIHGLDRSKGLDLFLHTPGGDIAATESLVDYLRAIFGTNVRAIVPQLAMSGGTMIACACKEVVMGKHSSLGPIDPQRGGIPAHGVIEEFNRAYKEIKADQAKAFVWQPIIAKYPPTFIGECEKGIQWSIEMTREWLLTGMLSGDPDAAVKVESIIRELSDHALTKSHARHLSSQKCREIGLRVVDLESDHQFQDAVLSVHHACIHTLTGTPAYKLIENQNGIAFIQLSQNVLMQNA